MREAATVLLVDSDLKSNAEVEEALLDAGYRVQVATSLSEAARILDRAVPDAILVGMEGSIREGEALADRLVQRRSREVVPTIVLSRFSPLTNGEQGVAARLPKPVNPVALAATLERALANRAAAVGVVPHGSALSGAREALPTQRELASRLSSEAVRIQEEERRKLSLELHDDIAQIMGNLVLMMDACLAIAPPETERLRGYLNNARETAKEGFRRVQRFSIDLRPPMLDDLGLAPTIAWYAERFTKDTGIPVSVAIPQRLPSLNGEQETALFRITQEALHNVRKHSQARGVSICLKPHGGYLRLAIEDDGIGFDSSVVEEKLADGHVGLAGMRYRVTLLKGYFSVTGASGHGTTVMADIPISTT